MILYLVYDKKQQRVSSPLLVNSLESALGSMKELNPENIEDLELYELCELQSSLDLFLLDINTTRTLPDFLTKKEITNVI